MNTRSPLQTTTTQNSSLQIGLLQRKCAQCDEKDKLLQRQAVNQTKVSDIPLIVHEVLRSPGHSLDPDTRTFMESRFGQDFSHVRVHTDLQAAESARTVNALAYTLKSDLVFASGQYMPNTQTGRQLLAHELTHVVQQSGAGNNTANSRDQMQRTFAPLMIGQADDQYEQEANAVSQQILASTIPSPPTVTALPGSSVQRQQTSFPDPPPILGQLNLSIDNQGKVDVTVVGPANTPIVKSPTIGIRRDANGNYHILVGNKDKVVSASEIPTLLRSIVQSGQSGGKPSKQTFRVPTCNQLIAANSFRYNTFDEFKLKQMLVPDLLPMSRALYEALLETCPPLVLPIPDKPPQQYNDAPTRTLPEGMEMA